MKPMSLVTALRNNVRRSSRDIALNVITQSPLVPRGLRPALLKATGIDIGNGCTVNASCFFGGTDISIGENTFVNYQCFFDNAAPITIGASVAFGPRVMIITGTHEIGTADRRAGAPTSSPVIIGDGAWVGADTVILPGVRIGAGAIVGAGSVVTKDVAPHTVVGGTPAKPLRSLEDSC